MSFIKEFKEFAMRGSMVDLAIGVIIGAAFGKVVSSFVSDIIMPPLGYLIHGIDFSSLEWKIKGGATPVAIKYGSFINNILDFAIVAFVIFLVIKGMNNLRETTPPAPQTMKCPECCMEIPIDAKKCGHCTSLIGH